ncbi:MAG TPA: DUF3616 domain-containing protein [Geminicoccaceae bacterium]|nr:DUF3616 domain-containing protein [Geminicoccus sp.]HMU52870.1 DUF3616 domain-containing protein [Geminicoccaceae bacterium]
MSGPDRPAGTARLDFLPRPEGRKKRWRDNLSAIARDGDTLFAADDEQPAILRLMQGAGTDWRQIAVDPLAALLPDLPGGPDGEMDIEGLDVHSGYLWVVGSHSLARRKPGKDGGGRRGIERLAEVRDDPNRHFLGRIPIVASLTAGPVDIGASAPGVQGRDLTLAHLQMQGSGRLVELLRQDEHLGRFVGIPAKENGFDIEGLAAAEHGRVFLGLRGPVLRGWAVILEMQLAPDGPGLLSPLPIGDGGRPYAKHFLDLGGLGLREMAWADGDLLLLAGPTMDLDGPVHVHRWREPLAAGASGVVDAERLGPPVLRLPFGAGRDHAEGMALVAPDELMVVYDSPADGRLVDDDGLIADLFRLPP